ncbi:MAG: ATP-binding protein [Magnetococcus sp. DMHC-6]
MNLSVRSKLFLASIVLVLVVILTIGIYLNYALSQWLETRISSELKSQVILGRLFLQEKKGDLTVEHMDWVADMLGNRLSKRVTIMTIDGVVLGDSQLNLEEIGHLESHDARPEVVDAIRAEFGQAKRYSNSVGTSMLYVAGLFHHSSGKEAVLRIAMSLQDLETTREHLLLVLVFAGTLAMVAALSVGGVATHLVTGTLRKLVRHAQVLAMEAGAQPIPVYQHDEISGLTGSLDQIALELRRNLQELSDARSHLEAVLEGMEEGVVALDNAGCMTLMNHYAKKLLAVADFQTGKPLAEVVQVQSLLNLLANTGESTVKSVEFDLPGPPVCQVLAGITTMGNQAGRILVLRDVTEIRRLEMIRRDFVANVSHELRTPVSVIQANAQTLMDGAMEDYEYSGILMEAIERNASRLSRIITDLLELSRLEAEHAPFELQPLYLAQAMDRVYMLRREMAENKNIDICFYMDPNTQILANGGALDRVLGNYLDNAIYYNVPGSCITIRFVDQNQFIRLEVEDNGIGIPQEHRSRIFERFYRVDSGRSRKVGGTGLGLAIAKHMVDRMGGEVGVDSVEPHGAKFWATFMKVT